MTISTDKRRGFTLTEMLAVLIIMSIIAALIVVAAKGAQKKAAYEAAKAGVQFISSQIDAYKNKRGELPPNLNADSVTTEAEIYQTLKQWGFEVPDSKRIDPWGNPYVIVFSRDYTSASNPGTFPLATRDPSSGYDNPYAVPNGTPIANPCWRIGALYSPWQASPTAWLDQAKEIHNGDPATAPAYMNQTDGYQVISAGPDGKIATRDDVDPGMTINADNVTNWTN